MKTLSNIVDQHQNREKARARKFLAEVEAAPLRDRQAARVAFKKGLTDGGHLDQGMRFLLGGDYGEGAYLMAQEIISRPRMNRVAALSQLLAAFEWQCPRNFARQAFLSLTKPEQNDANAVIGSFL